MDKMAYPLHILRLNREVIISQLPSDKRRQPRLGQYNKRQ